MKKFDVIVIGSGGGAKIVSPCAKMGLKVAVIEKSALGGTCLNRGCIPSKMLIHPADVIHQIQHAQKFDINVPPSIKINFHNLIKRISHTVDHDSQKIVNGYSQNPNITFFKGEGKFLENKVILVNNIEITADKIFIAVGARPDIPKIQGLDKTPFMTSTEALRHTHLPKSLVVIGGGYIAVELGYAYAALGCEVHFLVRRSLLRQEDKQTADEFSRVFCQQHQVYLQTAVNQVDYSHHHFNVTYFQGTSPLPQHLMSEALLVATGVVPNTDILGLENTSIECNEQGFIKVNEYLQTSALDVYALGDCIGRYLYRHSVNFEGEYLMRILFEQKIRTPIQYPPMPHAVFSNPQVASVGKTEEQLQKEGIPYIVGLNPYSSSAMGMALLSDHGFVKILVDKSSRKILGAHIVGPEAANMIHMLIAFMSKDGTLDDLLNMIYIHPALPEIVRNAARKAQGEFEKLEQSKRKAENLTAAR